MYNKYFTVPLYESKSSIILSATDSELEGQTEEITSTDITINEKLVNTYAEIVKSDSVLDKVVQNLSLSITSKKLAKNISVSTDPKTTVIKISVKAETPDIADKISNEVITHFFEKIDQLYNIKTAKILDEPKSNYNAVNINPGKWCLIGAFVGLCIAIGVALLMDMFNDNIKSEKEVEDKLKLYVLTKVPKFTSKSQLVSLNERSFEAEAFRTLVANIKHLKKRAVLITSNTPDEGKSTVSVNLALTYASSGMKTLLIDCDMRKGTQHLMFNLPNKKGLSNLISDDSADYKKVVIRDVVGNLDVITRGSASINYSRLLFSTIIGKIVEQAKDEYDFIVIDGTPSQLVSDDTVLYQSVDASIIVIKYNNTKVSDVAKIKSTIKRSGGQVLGTIINSVPREQMGSKKYGYYDEHPKSLTTSRNRRH